MDWRRGSGQMSQTRGVEVREQRREMGKNLESGERKDSIGD